MSDGLLRRIDFGEIEIDSDGAFTFGEKAYDTVLEALTGSRWTLLVGWENKGTAPTTLSLAFRIEYAAYARTQAEAEAATVWSDHGTLSGTGASTPGHDKDHDSTGLARFIRLQFTPATAVAWNGGLRVHAQLICHG